MEQINKLDVKPVVPVIGSEDDIALDTLRKLESDEPILQSEDDIGIKKEPEKLKL